MTDLVDISEAALLHNLRVRYEKDLIFTATGPIIVSVNPFRDVGLFTPEHIATYLRAGLWPLCLLVLLVLTLRVVLPHHQALRTQYDNCLHICLGWLYALISI